MSLKISNDELNAMLTEVTDSKGDTVIFSTEQALSLLIEVANNRLKEKKSLNQFGGFDLMVRPLATMAVWEGDDFDQ